MRLKRFSLICFLIAAIILGWQGWAYATAAACSGSICYVDSTSTGTGDGTTQATTGANAAFKTIAEVNALTYAQDTQILFKRGQTWREQLTVPSSGTTGHPITFGAYGTTGANPLIIGSSVFSTSGYTLYNPGNVNTYSYAVSNAGGGSYYGYRTVIDTTHLSVSAAQIKVELCASAGNDAVLVGVGIGPATGTNSNASAMTRVTWDSGASGTTITKNTCKQSDTITYALDHAVAQVVATTYSSAYPNFGAPIGVNMWYKSVASDDSQATTQPTGYGALGTNGGVSKIIAIGASYSYTYTAAAASTPGWVWENTVGMNQQTSINAVESNAGSWYWDGSHTYLHAWDGTNVATNSKTYEYYHVDQGIDTNNKDHLVINGIDTTRTGGSDATMGGINVTGIDTVVENLSTGNHRRHCVSCYTGATSGCVINNVTAYNSLVTTPISIYNTAAGALIENSDISNNVYSTKEDGFGCIVVHGGATNNTIQNNHIHDCSDGTNLGSGVYTYDSATSGLTISGNTFDGVMTDAVRANDTVANVTISNNSISNTVQPAISTATYAVNNWSITGNTITGCGVATDTLYFPAATSLSITNNSIANGGNGDLIYFGGTGLTVSGNTLTASGPVGHGISIVPGASTVSIFKNNISLCPLDGIQVSGANVSIYQNYIHGNTANGIETQNAGATGLQIYDNIITGHTVAGESGISLNVGGNGAAIYNNDLYGNNRGYTGSGQTGILFKNNIVYNNAAYGVRDATNWNYTFNNNDVYGNTTANYSGGTNPTGSNGNISANPLFTNPSGSYSVAGDFKLGPGSPAIWKGTNVSILTDYGGFPIHAGGTLPSMGAWEFLNSGVGFGGFYGYTYGSGYIQNGSGY